MTDTLAAQALEMMAIDRLRPAEDNPRDSLGELGELTDSIEAIGVLQPLTVIPTGEIGGAEDLEIHLVVAGHRRLAAAILAERTEVPVIVRTDIDEQARQQSMFIENFHRLDLSVLERARALKQLESAGASQRDIGKKVGISQGTVSKWLALLKLPEKAQAWVSGGDLSQEDAVALAALPADIGGPLLEREHPPLEWEIRRGKETVETQKKVASAHKEAKKNGWKVLDEDPDLYQQLGLEGDDNPVGLDLERDYPEGLLRHVDPAEHQSEPCHAVHIDGRGDVLPACTDAQRHLPAPENWKSPAEIKDEAEIEDETPKKRAVKRAPARRKSPWELEREERDKAKALIEQKLDPIVIACRAVITAETIDPAAVTWAMLSVLGENDWWEFDRTNQLLGLASKPRDYSGEAVQKALSDGGAIDGARALIGWGLGLGLDALVDAAAGSIVNVTKPGKTPAKRAAVRDAETLERVEAFLTLIGGPTFEDFVASLTATENAEITTTEGPTVEVYEHKGKFKKRCSECGDLPGQNTEEKLARDRCALHLKETHGIEAAAAA